MVRWSYSLQAGVEIRLRTIMVIAALTSPLLAASHSAALAEPLPAWLQGSPPPLPSSGADTDRMIADSLEEAGGRGIPLTFNGGIYGDIIGVFFGFLASGSYDRAYRMQDGVCAAWRVLPPNGPFKGAATIDGTEVSLDRMCGIGR
jgi:hypothetical protein